jgi:hypothetical protein
MLSENDLKEEEPFKNYQNFSIGIQMLPTAFKNFPVNETYTADCEIIHRLTQIVVYNYKSKGFDGIYTNTVYGGTTEMIGPAGPFSYSIYENKNVPL